MAIIRNWKNLYSGSSGICTFQEGRTSVQVEAPVALCAASFSELTAETTVPSAPTSGENMLYAIIESTIAPPIISADCKRSATTTP